MEKQIKNFWVAGFFLPAINATVFSKARIPLVTTSMAQKEDHRSHQKEVGQIIMRTLTTTTTSLSEVH